MVEPFATVIVYTPSRSVVTALRVRYSDQRFAILGRGDGTGHPQLLGKSRE